MTDEPKKTFVQFHSKTFTFFEKSALSCQTEVFWANLKNWWQSFKSLVVRKLRGDRHRMQFLQSLVSFCSTPNVSQSRQFYPLFVASASSRIRCDPNCCCRTRLATASGLQIHCVSIQHCHSIVFLLLKRESTYILLFSSSSQILSKGELENTWPSWVEYLTVASHLLLALNSSVNLLLYCFCDRHIGVVAQQKLKLLFIWPCTFINAFTSVRNSIRRQEQ